MHHTLGQGAFWPAVSHSPAITVATLQLYLKRAFSAPKICTVEAGYLAKLVRLPAWEISRAPTYRQETRRRCEERGGERWHSNWGLWE